MEWNKNVQEACGLALEIEKELKERGKDAVYGRDISRYQSTIGLNINHLDNKLGYLREDLNEQANDPITYKVFVFFNIESFVRIMSF